MHFLLSSKVLDGSQIQSWINYIFIFMNIIFIFGKWGEIETNGRKRYFHIDEIASSEQIFALLDDAESADEDDIDNLMNDSNTEFIAGEEITQAASTQDTFLTTPEANLHIVPYDNQSKMKEKSKKEGL